MAMTTTDRTVPLGLIVITRGALFTLDETDVMGALARHRSGDWGDIGEQDWQANDEALEQGRRILSAYRAHNDERFWIITEHDRSATTILLPQEY